MASGLTKTTAASSASSKAREYGQWLSDAAVSATQSAAQYIEERYESYGRNATQQPGANGRPAQRAVHRGSSLDNLDGSYDERPLRGQPPRTRHNGTESANAGSDSRAGLRPYVSAQDLGRRTGGNDRRGGVDEAGGGSRSLGEGETRWMKLVSDAASQAKDALASRWEQRKTDEGYGAPFFYK
jgi:hypothetical protein